MLLLVQCFLTLVYKETEFPFKQEEKEDVLPARKVSADTNAKEPGELYAQSAVLMDADSGRILFGKNEEEIRPMASTTKIMTCILVLEQKKPGQIATVSELAASQPEVHLGTRKGEQYWVSDLLYSLMLESHNDSAVILAETIGGSVEQFATMMNEKAKKLGCENTHFVTPNGLDGEDEEGKHTTTAKDLARIMRYCIEQSPKKEEFLAITRTSQHNFSNLEETRTFSCYNHNAFLAMMKGALSGKTGFTAEAGYCYVGALKQDDRTFIVALLACGWPGNKSYKWKDTKKLMEYGLSYYHCKDVLQEMPEVWVQVKGGANEKSFCLADSEVRIEVSKKDKTAPLHMLLADWEKITVKKEIEPHLQAPVKTGEKAGAYVYYLNREEIKRYPLVACNSVKKRSYPWCVEVLLKQICFA